jgi:hypothetical protein
MQFTKGMGILSEDRITKPKKPKTAPIKLKPKILVLILVVKFA